MPDFKYWSAGRSKTYMQAANYPDAARAAIRRWSARSAHSSGPSGLARRGVLIRHLVMPECLDETQAILEWIAGALGSETYVNLMDQYYPAGKVDAERYPELTRRLSAKEFLAAKRMAADLGLRPARRAASEPPGAGEARGPLARHAAQIEIVWFEELQRLVPPPRGSRPACPPPWPLRSTGSSLSIRTCGCESQSDAAPRPRESLPCRCAYPRDQLAVE